MRKRIITIAILSIVLLIVATPLTFGWLTNAVFTPSLDFSTANIASTLRVYEGIDSDHDGFLDVDNYSEAMFEDLYYSNRDVTKKNVSLEMKDIIPTYVYTWRLELENLGDVDGFIEVSINNELYDYSFVRALKLSFTKYYIDNIGNLVDESKSLSEIYLGNVNLDTANDETIIYGIDSDNNYTDRLYCAQNASDEDKYQKIAYIMQIEMITYDEVVNNNINLTEAEYQAIQGSEYTDIYFMSLTLSSK